MNINVVRSKRKSLLINVDDFGDVKVNAPINISNDKIYQFIKSKENWINKHVLKKQAVIYEFSEVLNNKKGLLFGKIVNIFENFDKYLRKTASEYLPSRIQYLSNKFNLKYKSLTIKNYKSRWGACDKNNNIFLNYKLVSLDSRLIDYVIIHELCHTKEFNHKYNFHKMLSSFFEDEKLLKENLKKFSFVTKLSYKK